MNPNPRQLTAEEAEHIERMSEPEPYRTLRLQKERIEAEFIRGLQHQNYDLKAEKLRKEIRNLGHKPEA